MPYECLKTLPKESLISLLSTAKSALVENDNDSEVAFKELQNYSKETEISDTQLKAVIAACVNEQQELANYKLAEERNEIAFQLQGELYKQFRYGIDVGKSFEELSEIKNFYSQYENILTEEQLDLFFLFVVANKDFIDKFEKELSNAKKSDVENNYAYLREKYYSQPPEKLDFIIRMAKF